MSDIKKISHEIKRENIDFSKVYTSGEDAKAGINPVKINNPENWGDNGLKLYYDPETLLVSEEQADGKMVGMGFVDGLKNVEILDLNLEENNNEIENNNNNNNIEKIENTIIEDNTLENNIETIDNTDNTDNTVSLSEYKQYVSLEPKNHLVPGEISPGTTKTTFNATSYSLNPVEREELIALVYAEAVEGNEYVTSDSMGVTSVILNRLEKGNWGDSVESVISASNQFSGYKSYKYNQAIANPAIVSKEMIDAVDRVLAGERNTTGIYFSGHRTYNKFR